MSAGRFGKVAVLMGGRSAEREISLLSGNAVLGALRERNVDAHAFDPKEREMADLKRENFSRAFIALHGRYGKTERCKARWRCSVLRTPAAASWPARWRWTNGVPN